jgi:hypothetical protein
MSGFSRREWLKGALAAAALSSLPWWRRMASAQSVDLPRNLLLVFAQGGWDVTTTFDPKLGLDTVDSPPGDLQRFGELTLLTGPQRPAVARFFTDFGAISAVVNGVEVRSIAHEECAKRIFTGTNSDASPDVAAISGVHHGADLAVPYMILGNTAYTGPFGGSTGRAGAAGQLVTLLHPDASYGKNFGGQGRFDGDAQEEALIRDFVAARARRDKALRAGDAGRNARKFDDLIGSIDRRDKLKALIRGGSDLSTQLELRPQMELAIKCFKENLSRAAVVEHGVEWDTHSESDPQQMANFEDLFGHLHFLMTSLERERLLDSTTVVVLSEMSRTPKRNEAMGKDHWPVTSALVIGTNVRGGRAYGATDDQLQSLPINLDTGLVDQQGQGITSASFAAGLLHLVGVDHAPWFPDTAPLRAIKG